MDYGTAMKSQWKTDIMEGGNEWLEPTGSQPEMNRGRKWITAGDESRPEMDRGRGWIAAREALRPEMDDKRWIPSGDESRHDMDRDRIWMDDRDG